MVEFQSIIAKVATKFEIPTIFRGYFINSAVRRVVVEGGNVPVDQVSGWFRRSREMSDSRKPTDSRE